MVFRIGEEANRNNNKKLSEWKEQDNRRQEAQERKEEYKQCILAYLSDDPELAITPNDIIEKILMPAYPDVLWSPQEAASLLDILCWECKLIKISTNPAAFRLSEFPPPPPKTQGLNESYKWDILVYLSKNPKSAVTPNDIMVRILMPKYPEILWSNQKTESLLNSLCDMEDKLIRIREKSAKNAAVFMINEAERRRLLKQTVAGRYRLEKEQKERVGKRAALESEQAALQKKLANLKGLFTGKRRREIETRLAEIDKELNNI